MEHTMKDVHDWARQNGECADVLRAVARIPARMGMLDADLASLSADPVRFEREIAGRGYALVGRARNVQANGRREDSRIRALLRRFQADRSGAAPRDEAARARYDALIALIKAHEGPPGSGARWAIGQHRALFGLRARTGLAPEELTQAEIDRIGREMSAGKRKGLRKAVAFLDRLAGLTNELPGLREFLPSARLDPPAGSGRARRVAWDGLPAPFRASFDAAADACVAGGDDLAERMLARIEAGEDPEAVMAEADQFGVSAVDKVAKPTAARAGYRESVAWLVRSWEDRGGDVANLEDLRELFSRPAIEGAILDQIERSRTAHDLRDPLGSATLKTRLTSLATLARRGLDDARAAATISLLRAKHYDAPRRKLSREADDALLMEVDRIFASLRQRPSLAGLWANAPRRIADAARRAISEARSGKDERRELAALRAFAGAVAYALQMSRPMRTECLRHCRIASVGDVHANLVRAAPRDGGLTFRFAPWEIKNARWVTVDVTGEDAAIVREWLDLWRPRMIELKKLAPEGPGLGKSPGSGSGAGAANVYLFPGQAEPKREDGDPVVLPRGCYAPSAFLDLWRDASGILGVHETPHRMRHVVALLILAMRPGDYGLVSAVLGNTEHTARTHYGRDDGQAAAREARAAMLAEHPDLFRQLHRRHAHEC